MKQFIVFLLFFSSTSFLSAQCYPDRHNTVKSESWLSCIQTQNPNPDRGISHWIMYDLGQIYEIKQSHFWNYNVHGETDNAIRQMVVDVSWDGNTWGEWGIIDLDPTNGSAFYEGQEGPDFSGQNARYVLFTAIENHGGDCFGLSEIKINVGEQIVTFTEDELEAIELSLSPNPADDFVNLSFEANDSGQLGLIVFDNSGRAVYNENSPYATGINTIRIDTKSFIPGLYHLSIRMNEEMRSIDFNVIR